MMAIRMEMSSMYSLRLAGRSLGGGCAVGGSLFVAAVGLAVSCSGVISLSFGLFGLSGLEEFILDGYVSWELGCGVVVRKRTVVIPG